MKLCKLKKENLKKLIKIQRHHKTSIWFHVAITMTSASTAGTPRSRSRRSRPRRSPRGAPWACPAGSPGLRRRVSKIGKFCKILQIFSGLVLGCIKTKFCKKIFVWQHFSSSTRFACFCTAAISNFSQKIGLKNQQFRWKFSKNFASVAKFAKCCQISKISAW